MVKRAHGYVADDGTFFLTAPEAELHEAYDVLANRLRPDGIDPERFIQVIREYYPEVARVVKAVGKVNSGSAESPPLSSESPSVNSTRTRHTPPLVELPPDEPEPVPDIRPRSQRKTVRS